MRYKIRHVPHRNLAASKRSIVVICGSLAFMLGTTSVGSSFLLNDTMPEAEPSSSAILSELDAPHTEQPLTSRRKTLGKHQPLILSQDKVQQPLNLGSAAAVAVVTQITKTSPTPTTASQTPPTEPTVVTPTPATTPTTPTEPTTTPTGSTPTEPTTPTPTEPTPDDTPPTPTTFSGESTSNEL